MLQTKERLEKIIRVAGKNRQFYLDGIRSHEQFSKTSKDLYETVNNEYGKTWKLPNDNCLYDCLHDLLMEFKDRGNHTLLENDINNFIPDFFNKYKIQFIISIYNSVRKWYNCQAVILDNLNNVVGVIEFCLFEYSDLPKIGDFY